MPRGKGKPLESRYIPSALANGDRNSCTVFALATVDFGGIPSQECWDKHRKILELAGREKNKGFRLETFLDNQCISKNPTYNVKKVSFIRDDRGKNKMTPKRFIEKFPKGKYIVIIAKHAFAVIDGVVYDRGKNRPGTLVFSAYEFLSMNNEQKKEASNKLRTILTDLGYQPRSYSGRGMYGRNCVGVEISRETNFFSIVAELFEYLADPYNHELEEYGDIAEAIITAFKSGQTDSMGLNSILYFPSMPWIE